MENRTKMHPIRAWLNRYPQSLAYLGLGLVLVLIFVLQGVGYHKQEVQRCRTGVDVRNVDRDQTQRIYALAMGSIPKNTSKLTRSQKKQLARYIKRVEDFRRESFKAIKPSELCAPYVPDDNVTPQQWERMQSPKKINGSGVNK